MPFETGPYIQAATFCENVIEDKTGVLSLIRVIDTLTHTASGPEPPGEMPPIQWKMKLVIMLKPGQARGRSEVKVVPQPPSGETGPSIIYSLYFETEDRGANLVLDVAYTFTMEGLYWFVVYLDDAFFTKIPFRVKYMRVVAGPRPK